MAPKCKKFEEAIKNNFIDKNYDGTYDIEASTYYGMNYTIITHCPFCGEKL